MFEKIQELTTAEKRCQEQQPVCRRKEFTTIRIASHTDVHLALAKTRTDFSHVNGLLSFENDTKMK